MNYILKHNLFFLSLLNHKWPDWVFSVGIQCQFTEQYVNFRPVENTRMIYKINRGQSVLCRTTIFKEISWNTRSIYKLNFQSPKFSYGTYTVTSVYIRQTMQQTVTTKRKKNTFYESYARLDIMNVSNPQYTIKVCITRTFILLTGTYCYSVITHLKAFSYLLLNCQIIRRTILLNLNRYFSSTSRLDHVRGGGGVNKYFNTMIY